jgi:hypothetical protein
LNRQQHGMQAGYSCLLGSWNSHAALVDTHETGQRTVVRRLLVAACTPPASSLLSIHRHGQSCGPNHCRMLSLPCEPCYCFSPTYYAPQLGKGVTASRGLLHQGSARILGLAYKTLRQ